MEDVSSLQLPDDDGGFYQNFHVRDGPGFGTATTTTIMPALLDSMALDATLPMDPSFVHIGNPRDHFPPVPSQDINRRKASVDTAETATSATTTTTSSSSAAALSKQRSVSTPTPATSSATHNHPHPTSKARQRHRSTKSHPHPAPIDDDLLLDLLKEFRAAKKREGAAGSLNLSLGVKSLLSHGSRAGQPHALHQPQVAPRPASPLSNLHDHPLQNHNSHSPPSHEPLDKPTPKKRRERASSTASSANPHSLSSEPTSESLVILLHHLQVETARANAAEAQAQGVAERLKAVMRERVEVEGQLAMVREELGLYKVQLDVAQKEILRAQRIVEDVDRQRMLAEKEATRNRERLRRVVEDRLVRDALEEGRREGYEEGVRRGREVEDERRRAANEQQRERDREREREKERHSKERAREKERERERERENEKLKERVARGRARSNTVGTVDDANRLRPIPPPRPPTAGPSNWPPVPPLSGLQPLGSTSQIRPGGPASWPMPPPGPPAAPPPAPPARSTTLQVPFSSNHQQGKEREFDEWGREQDVDYVPDTGHFASVLPRPALTTPIPLGVPHSHPQPAPALSSMHPQRHQHHSHSQPPPHHQHQQEQPARRGSDSSSSSSRSDTAKRPPPEPVHVFPSSPSTTKLQALDPHFDKVSHPQYVPPPDNYIPVLGADGLVSLPPPHELGERQPGSVAPQGGGVGPSGSRLGGDVTPRARRHSEASSTYKGDGRRNYDQPPPPVPPIPAHDRDHHSQYANPEREREREKLRKLAGGGGTGEVITPTPIKPSSLPEGHVMTGYQGSSLSGGAGSSDGGRGKGKRKGRMHVVNADPDAGDGDGGNERPGSRAGQAGRAGYAGIERPKTVEPQPHPVPPPVPPPRSRLRGVSLSESRRELGIVRPGNGLAPVPPVPPVGWDSLAAPSRMGEGGFVTPEDRRPMLRTMTSGTTPDIGVEPPSQSPTSAGDITVPLNPVFLSPHAVPQAIPPNSTPQSYQDDEYDDHNHHQNQGYGNPTLQQPYGRPQYDDKTNHHEGGGDYFSGSHSHGWTYQDPKQQGGFDFQNHPFVSSTPNSNASSGINKNYLGSPAYSGQQDASVESEWAPPPPVALSPIPMMTNLDLKPVKGAGSPFLGKDDWVYGRPNGGVGGDGKYLSPAPLDRPISLFEDSE